MVFYDFLLLSKKISKKEAISQNFEKRFFNYIKKNNSRFYQYIHNLNSNILDKNGNLQEENFYENMINSDNVGDVYSFRVDYKNYIVELIYGRKFILYEYDDIICEGYEQFKNIEKVFNNLHVKIPEFYNNCQYQDGYVNCVEWCVGCAGDYPKIDFIINGPYFNDLIDPDNFYKNFAIINVIQKDNL